MSDWRAHAACRGVDTNVFFPERGQSLEPALRICAGCPVRDHCLEEALGASIAWKYVPGVWGGTSERQRRQMRHQRRLAS